MPVLYESDGTQWIQVSGGSASTVARFEIKVISDTSDFRTGDGQFLFAIPIDINGFSLSSVAGFVTTVGSSLTTVQIRNATTANDMLSTAITIDVSETTSYTAATPPVINPTFAIVSTADLIAVDIDGAGTGAKGLGVILGFS
jgi:hypothetical protein